VVPGVGGGEVDDPERGLRTLGQRQRHGIERQTVDEVDGAIDGIQDPSGTVRVATGAPLLAKEADIGGGGLQLITQPALDVEIHLRGKVPVALGSEATVPMGIVEDLDGQVDRLLGDGKEVLGG
jgi:hypothetical protein